MESKSTYYNLTEKSAWLQACMLKSIVPYQKGNIRGILTQPPGYQIQNKFRS